MAQNAMWSIYVFLLLCHRVNDSSSMSIVNNKHATCMQITIMFRVQLLFFFSDGMMEEFKKCGYFDTLCAGKIVTETVRCYESLNDLIHIPGPNGPHKKEIELYDICDYTVQCFSTALQDDKERTGYIDDIKGGLDDVHRTQPQPAPMLWITGECA